MVETDSVSIFAEGTFEEQIQELVNYLVRHRSEEERNAFIRPFQDAFKTHSAQKLDEHEEGKRLIFCMVLKEVKGLGEGNDKEIEGFFNLIYSHLFTLFPSDTPEAEDHLSRLLQAISTAADHHLLKFRLFSNLFNAIPRTSSLRLLVSRTLLQLATSKEELQLLQLSRGDVEKWLSEWGVTPQQSSDYLQCLVAAFERVGQPDVAYEYECAYVRLLPYSSQARAAALDLIATALRLPSVFNFDTLFKMDAVIGCKDHPLFSLLRIFLNEGLLEFQSWSAKHSDILPEHKLELPKLEHKIKLLTLASIGFQNIGQDLPYSKIATSLQIEPSEVEVWVIDVIRAGLLSGKLSQTNQTLRVVRSAARTFERAQWEVLEIRLLAWKTGLASVMDVLAAARKRGEPSSQVPPPTTQSQAEPLAT